MPTEPASCFIDPSDAGYRRRVDAIFSSLQDRQLLPFLAAGISLPAPSCLPLAKGPTGLKAPLVRALAGACEQSRALPDPADRQRAAQAIDSQQLESILDALTRVFGPEAIDYLNVLDIRQCNDNHRAVAALASKGLLPALITPNFDILIECALGDTPHEVHCPLDNATLRPDDRRPHIRIVKPHGSLDLPALAGDRFRHVVATISRAGNQPAIGNVEAIRRLLADHPCLLFAGYSDEDWDISPIFWRLSDRIREVTWVQHVDTTAVRDRRQVPLPDRVSRWLAGMPAKAHVLYGDITNLLCDLLKMAGQDLDRLPAKPVVRRLDAERFAQPTEAAVLAASMLMRDTEMDIKYSLLDWLEGREIVGRTPRLQIEWLRAQSWRWHTQRRYRLAIRVRRQAMKCAQAFYVADSEQCAEDEIALGYSCLTYTKRPRLSSPRQLLAWPLALGIGIWHLWRGRRRSSEPLRRGRAHYYLVDLFHNWASHLLLLGHHRFPWLRRRAFGLVAAAYARVAREAPALMGWEYYWMRHFESRVLAGERPDRRDAETMLYEIENLFAATQGFGQLRNVHASRALLEFAHDPASPRVDEELEKAERGWGDADATSPSGRLRLLLFRRFMRPETIGGGDLLRSLRAHS